VALQATMRRFHVALAHTDRDIYTDLDLRAAQHPSESDRYLVARVLARALEHADGLEFSKAGVSDDTEPALVQRDLRRDLVAWIEIGSPTPERLHKAAKASPRVVVYTWKSATALRDALIEAEIHRADEIEIIGLPQDLLDAIASTLDRTNRWELSVSGGTVYLTVGGRLFEAALDMVGSTQERP
jgi:uncharacterized protein YaeQ